MNSLIIFSTLFAAVFSLPVDTNVNVQQSTDGSYIFHYVGVDSSRLEERKPDGSVSGYYTFLDKNGDSHTIHYTSGPLGFAATSADLPLPVGDLPEVAKTRADHAALFSSIAAELPPLGPDGLVPEVEPVPLSRERFFGTIVDLLSKPKLQFVEDTEEIAQAKQELIQAHKQALGL